MYLSRLSHLYFGDPGPVNRNQQRIPVDLVLYDFQDLVSQDFFTKQESSTQPDTNIYCKRPMITMKNVLVMSKKIGPPIKIFKLQIYVRD